jgi:hypothetical protein
MARRKTGNGGSRDESIIDQILLIVKRLDEKIDELGRRIDQTNLRIDQTNLRLDKLLENLGSHFRDHERRLVDVERRTT